MKKLILCCAVVCVISCSAAQPTSIVNTNNIHTLAQMTAVLGNAEVIYESVTAEGDVLEYHMYDSGYTAEFKNGKLVSIKVPIPVD